MGTYRVENGRGQAGSSHQLKAQSATTLLCSRYFLGTAPVDRSSRAPQFAAPMKEPQGISCRMWICCGSTSDLTDTLELHSLTQRVHRISPR
ncbi:hypothetical protein EAG_08415 [Camponotus floridanus]|uniref:Uncharacterized protein n=1 Tax=Camponotus floridanus TaxID=104421 RepID=E1ZYS8_CAMFO|nr:hypothetical protein EAG_08415 [Camponotus floridanus]